MAKLTQHAHYTDQAALSQRKLRSTLEQRWENLSTTDRALTFAKENKFSVVLGSWVTSMGASWLYIQSQPLSFSQKIVQARVWAQGLTVASLLLMAGVSRIPTAGDQLMKEEHEMTNHSWRDMIHDESDNDRETVKDLRQDVESDTSASK